MSHLLSAIRSPRTQTPSALLRAHLLQGMHPCLVRGLKPLNEVSHLQYCNRIWWTRWCASQFLPFATSGSGLNSAKAANRGKTPSAALLWVAPSYQVWPILRDMSETAMLQMYSVIAWQRTYNNHFRIAFAISRGWEGLKTGWRIEFIKFGVKGEGKWGVEIGDGK